MRAVWLSGLIAAVLFACLAWYLAPLKPGVVALQFAFTPKAFGEIVHTWSAGGIAHYRRHLPFDCLLLVAYGAFGYLLATRTNILAGTGRFLRMAATWSLPLAATADAAENALHWWLTAEPRFGVPAVYALAAGSSAAKWLLIAGFGLAVAYAGTRTRA
jgi:hypothetical protein